MIFKLKAPKFIIPCDSIADMKVKPRVSYLDAVKKKKRKEKKKTAPPTPYFFHNIMRVLSWEYSIMNHGNHSGTLNLRTTLMKVRCCTSLKDADIV